MWLGVLICVLVGEGLALVHSDVWAAPLLGLLAIALAIEIPLVPFLGGILLIRILTDASLSSQATRHTGSVNLSSGIAILFILIAIGLFIRRRQNAVPVIALAAFIGLGTLIAVTTHGASAETLREGVREISIVALGVIVLNSRGVLTVSRVTRIVQLAGVGSALVAIYQLATHGGLLIQGEVRSNGTFTHPDGAAMYFAIAATASLWQYLYNGHRRLDVMLLVINLAAAFSTFSITGLIALLAMLGTFGTLSPGSARLKLGSYAAAIVIVVAFLLSPLGAQRIAKESSNRKNASSLQWRFYKWGTLIPKWERSPFIGEGIGATVTVENTSENTSVGLVPHNEYLRYLVETGVIGLMFVVAALGALFRSLFRTRRFVRTPGAGTMAIAIVVGCMVNAIADNTLLYTTTGYALALIVAAVLARPPGVAGRAVEGTQTRRDVRRPGERPRRSGELIPSP
jgi:O-antigen ligase